MGLEFRLRRLGHVRLIGQGFKFEGSGLLQLLSLLGSVVFMLGPQCAVFHLLWRPCSMAHGDRLKSVHSSSR